MPRADAIPGSRSPRRRRERGPRPRGSPDRTRCHRRRTVRSRREWPDDRRLGVRRPRPVTGSAREGAGRPDEEPEHRGVRLARRVHHRRDVARRDVTESQLFVRVACQGRPSRTPCSSARRSAPPARARVDPGRRTAGRASDLRQELHAHRHDRRLSGRERLVERQVDVVARVARSGEREARRRDRDDLETVVDRGIRDPNVRRGSRVPSFFTVST